MKTLVRSNQVLIQTALSAEDFDKYSKYGAYIVVDEKGNIVFKVLKGTDGAVTTFGVRCNTVYQGKLAISFTHTNTAEETKAYVEELKPALLALKENEEIIQLQLDDIKDRLGSIDSDIVIED